MTKKQSHTQVSADSRALVTPEVDDPGYTSLLSAYERATGAQGKPQEVAKMEKLSYTGKQAREEVASRVALGKHEAVLAYLRAMVTTGRVSGAPSTWDDSLVVAAMCAYDSHQWSRSYANTLAQAYGLALWDGDSYPPAGTYEADAIADVPRETLEAELARMYPHDAGTQEVAKEVKNMAKTLTQAPAQEQAQEVVTRGQYEESFSRWHQCKRARNGRWYVTGRTGVAKFVPADDVTKSGKLKRACTYAFPLARETRQERRLAKRVQEHDAGTCTCTPAHDCKAVEAGNRENAKRVQEVALE